MLRLPAEHASAAVGIRIGELRRDDRIERRTGRGHFQSPRLLVEALDRPEFFVASELRFAHRRLQDRDRLAIDLQGHRIRMAILSAMREREPRWITEPARRAVHDLCDHGERLYCARADPWRGTQIGKILRAV